MAMMKTWTTPPEAGRKDQAGLPGRVFNSGIALDSIKSVHLPHRNLAHGNLEYCDLTSFTLVHSNLGHLSGQGELRRQCRCSVGGFWENIEALTTKAKTSKLFQEPFRGDLRAGAAKQLPSSSKINLDEVDRALEKSVLSSFLAAHPKARAPIVKLGRRRRFALLGSLAREDEGWGSSSRTAIASELLKELSSSLSKLLSELLSKLLSEEDGDRRPGWLLSLRCRASNAQGFEASARSMVTYYWRNQTLAKMLGRAAPHGSSPTTNKEALQVAYS
ncbi:hypothetical protein IE81DRAFT_331523 [Ceraceosorus guamensis]|uniref:Uncharacterized protein n=1 Tax=Ceraceosorus guamensis TaxID=1522189 RepID=A0A316VYR1_9BASI|nr:hypothetical protein IE81DRAFT_331523 [Ceraceosorus guamensis]PWN40615.1 hypothetical protein IE81DRAFT_331523 [Ceraceosorus guamensis]